MSQDHHDRGLAFDLATLSRRHALKLFAGAGAFALVGCGSGDDSTSSAATSTTGTTGTTAASGATTDVDEIPDETAGPYPGDGSNGPDALAQDGIVRQDIRSSFGSSTTTVTGVPIDIEMTILDAASDTPLPGAAVYLWHCDKDGNYSMYSSGVEDENYLRGVQVADDSGALRFTSIFPGAYSGRYPHAHFAVYASLDEALGGGSPIKTTQLAFPGETCELVYATSGYEQSTSNFPRTPLEQDDVFSDGSDDQMATVTGTVDAGLVGSLTVGV